MNLSTLFSKDIILGSSVAGIASKLYNDEYDRRMRVPFSDLEKLYADHKADLVAVFDDDLFVGFYYVYKYEDLALIYFLAVPESMRGRGYGTDILGMIIERYSSHYRIVVNIEAPLVDDKLVSSRHRHIVFFTSNGFIDSLYKFESVGIQYEVLYFGAPWDPENIHKMLRSFRRCCGYRR